MEVEEILTADKKSKFQLKEDHDFYTIMEPVDQHEDKFNLLIYYKDALQWRHIVKSYQDALKISLEILTKLYFHNLQKKKMITESPDGVRVDKKRFMWFEKQAYGFNYDALGNLMVTPPGRSHYDSFRLGREQMINSGRLWLNDKIISFWDYPNANRLNNIISDLEKYFKVAINKKEWLIEIVTDDSGRVVLKPYSGKMWVEEVTQIVSIEEYEGMQISTGVKKQSIGHALQPFERLITKFSDFKMK